MQPALHPCGRPAFFAALVQHTWSSRIQLSPVAVLGASLSISCISHAGRVDSVEQARTKSRSHSVPLLKCLCVNVLAAHDHDIILFGVVVCSVFFLVCPTSTLQCLHSASTWCPFDSLTLPCTLNALCQKKTKISELGKRRGRGGGARCSGMDE